ncbi:hypothetical protein C8R44DRAFT_877079 [Mycena epipterygia]|nr:hypothetical protein C8R44DRAFT_877079 [Mycena epipterygia]
MLAQPPTFQQFNRPGSEFIWDLGDILASYPLSIHTQNCRRDPGYQLLGIDLTKSVLRIIRDWALQPFGKKSSSHLSHNQLVRKLDSVSKQLKNEQLKKADHFKSLKRSQSAVRSHNKFFDLISTNIVPGISRLLSNAKKEGWSISKTSDIVLRAIQGKYHPWNYTDFDRDLAILIYELGGGAALYALNKSPIMLPSRQTISAIRRNHSLRITVGDVKVSDVLENIEMLFRNVDVAEQGRVCITLSQDEIAGDATVKAIREDRVHVGKEFSVAAFSRHAQSDYGAKPVLLMPTCKKTSDGDGGRRAVLYLVCMNKKLSEDDPLYRLLSGLAGLNLYTGENALTMDFDYKHLFKCLCKLLCSKEGILVNNVIINKSLIAQWLERLAEHDWSDENIHALLNPKDTQDVPRAVKLLSLSAELRLLDPADFTTSERKTHRALSLLSEMFEALLEPFINPMLSLSEQITSLIKFAHLVCALFLQHETDFLPNQLYGDLQCMVKNAIFKIAHSKNLDPTPPKCAHVAPIWNAQMVPIFCER